MAENVTNVNKWLPDRKWVAGGVVGVVLGVGYTVAVNLGVNIPEELAYSVIPIAMWLVAYFVPPSLQDKLKRVDDELKKIILGEGDNPPVENAPPNENG